MLLNQIAEMERQQTSPDQVLALQGELQQLTERLERVQLENQDKQDVCIYYCHCHSDCDTIFWNFIIGN